MQVSSHVTLTVTFQGTEEIRLFKLLCGALHAGGSKDIPHLTTNILFSTDGTKVQKLMESISSSASNV